MSEAAFLFISFSLKSDLRDLDFPHLNYIILKKRIFLFLVDSQSFDISF